MNDLTVFRFEGTREVRTVVKDEEPWFVAKDICDILELTNPTMAIESLDDDERSKYFLGRQGEVNIINESGDSAETSADTFCIGLQRAVQCGVLSNVDAGAIEAAARYTAAYSWSPPDVGICGMVDGVADQLDSVFRGSKRNRIAAAGNGQVPLQAAAAWMILAHTI